MVVSLCVMACGKPPVHAAASERAVSVAAAKVVRDRLEKRLELIGSLAAVDEVHLQAEDEVRVTAFHFEEGAHVEKGQLLVTLDDRKAQARLAETRARSQRARSELRQAKKLLRKKVISAQEYNQLREAAVMAKAELRLSSLVAGQAIIRAPFSGMIGERQASVGQLLAPGDTIATLTGVDPIEVKFEVPERFVAAVTVGQSVHFVAPAFPGEAFEGKVRYSSPKIDPSSRSLAVKAQLENDDLRLRPGMFGHVELVLDVAENALVIPEAAISQRGERASVMVVDENRKAHLREVLVGGRVAGRVEIAEGVREGEIVVVEGHQKLREGSSIVFGAGSSRYGVEPDEAPADPSVLTSVAASARE